MNAHAASSGPKKRLRRPVGALIGIGIGVLALGPSTAHADTIVVELDRLVFGAPGTTTVLAVETIADSLVGNICSAHYTGENNSSVHPGNDLIVSTGSSTVTLEGVEDVAGAVTSSDASVTLGGTVTVSLRFGNDAMASLGSHLVFDCAVVPPTTTEAPATTTPATTTPATTVADAGPGTTATTAPPATGVASGGPVPRASVLPASTSPVGTIGALPITGPSSSTTVLVGGAACLAIGALITVSRRRSTNS